MKFTIQAYTKEEPLSADIETIEKAREKLLLMKNQLDNGRLGIVKNIELRIMELTGTENGTEIWAQRIK